MLRRMTDTDFVAKGIDSILSSINLQLFNKMRRP